MKMNFNPDLSKQTQEVIFSKRTKKVNHPTHIFNNNFVAQITFQKHFGVAFASRLTFHYQLTFFAIYACLLLVHLNIQTRK